VKENMKPRKLVSKKPIKPSKLEEMNKLYKIKRKPQEHEIKKSPLNRMKLIIFQIPQRMK